MRFGLIAAVLVAMLMPPGGAAVSSRAEVAPVRAAHTDAIVGHQAHEAFASVPRVGIDARQKCARPLMASADELEDTEDDRIGQVDVLFDVARSFHTSLKAAAVGGVRPLSRPVRVHKIDLWLQRSCALSPPVAAV